MNLLKKIKLIPNAIMGFERGDPNRNGEYKFIRTYLKNDMTIFDAGANTGYYAQHILSINHTVRIHCFEPTIRAYKELACQFGE